MSKLGIDLSAQDVDTQLRLIMCDTLEYISDQDLTDDTLLSDLQLDSLDLVDVASHIRIMTGVSVSVWQLHECKTYRDLRRLVRHNTIYNQ